MKVQLTLSIEKEVIELSKRFASSQNLSLSELVEFYLWSIAVSEGKNIEITNKIRTLSGSFKAPSDFDYKKVLSEEIVRKHGEGLY